MSQFRSLCFLPLLLITLTGCAATLRTSPLPEGYAVGTIAKIDRGAPLAVSSSGAIATVAEEGIQVFTLAGGPGRPLIKGVPEELSYAPAGDRLAASYPGKDQSTLRVLDQQGTTLAETVIPGKITSIVWRSDKELLVTAIVIKRFSFGSELIGTLFHWDTVNPPLATPLSDSTVRPVVAKLPEETLLRSLLMALSPYGDEIAYSTLKDPPLFTPYLAVKVKHLETGAEREVAQVSIGSGKPQYAPDGETLLVGNARSVTRRVALPDGKEIDAWPAAGNHDAVSPGGSYLLLDGRLYQGGRELVSVPGGCQGAFLPDGSGVVLGCDGGLFLLAGLREPQRPALAADSDKVLELRRLRALGLITEKEFKARKEKLQRK